MHTLSCPASTAVRAGPPPAQDAPCAIDVQPFQPRHAVAVRDLVLAIQQQEFSLPVTAESQPDLLDIPGHYQRGLGNFWVALREGQVVGSIGLLDIGEGRGALRKMFVAAPMRGSGSGVAQRLLDTLLQWCSARGMQEVWLGTTEKFLAAHRFYEKSGFARVDRRQLPHGFPVMAVDTRFYRWSGPLTR
jgi:N-acetylglutamate synthase-like GNAT family acetyltransferase